VSSQRLETSYIEHPESKTDFKSETPQKKNKMIFPLSSATLADKFKTIEGKKLIELGSPIASLNPL